jgi:hypothetical protein
MNRALRACWLVLDEWTSIYLPLGVFEQMLTLIAGSVVRMMSPDTVDPDHRTDGLLLSFRSLAA